jgi:hypothetical protein
VKFHTTPKGSTALQIIIGLALVVLPFTAHADAPAKADAPLLAKAGKTKAVTVRSPKATAATVTAGDDSKKAKEESFPLSASFRVDTTMGLGIAIAGEQQQASVSVTLWPSLVYRLPFENLTLSASMTATIYALNDYGTNYPNGELIAGDLYITLGHSKIFESKDIADGFKIAAYFRIYFPTSPTSQLFNRVMTIRPFVSASLKAGPVTIAYTIMLAKYFATTTTSTVDCTNFKEGECIQGRPAGGSFASQVDGDQVSLTGAGNSSFYVANSLSIDFALAEGLALGASVAVYNIFGYRNYDADDLASVNAKSGRNQTDRLLFGVELSYQIHKHFLAGISWDVDSIRPFGGDGQGFDAIAPVSSMTLKLSTSI